MGVVDLYMTDFCPYAERAWLAFLEKEADPSSPKLFRYIEVNFFNRSLPLTQEFLQLHNTVPAGRHDGEELRESLPIVYWVDAKYPNNPLQPPSAEGKEVLKGLIKKYTTGATNVTAFHELLALPSDDPKAPALWANLLAVYQALSADLAASGGPYLLGEQFSVADIALIPFVDRGLLFLGHFKNLRVPHTPEFAAFHAWRAAYSARPSHRITNADRLPRSIAVQPFGATKRDEYLIELAAMYANGVREEARAQLANAPPGVFTVDIPKALAEKARKEKIVRQNRLLKVAAFSAFVAVAVAKLVSAVSAHRKQRQ